MQAHGFDIGLSPYFAPAIDGDRQIQKVYLFGWLGHLPIQNSELQFFPHELLEVLPLECGKFSEIPNLYGVVDEAGMQQQRWCLKCRHRVPDGRQLHQWHHVLVGKPGKDSSFFVTAETDSGDHAGNASSHGGAHKL